MIASGTDIEPVEILLVEDNPVDVLITKNACIKRCKRSSVCKPGNSYPH